MIKHYDVTVYEYYYKSSYEENLTFNTEQEAKDFEQALALRYVPDVLRFFRKRIPDNFYSAHRQFNSIILDNDLSEISYQYKIKKGILRIDNSTVIIKYYNEETGQWYTDDDDNPQLNREQINNIITRGEPDPTWPWYKKLIYKIGKGLRAAGELLEQWWNDFIDLLKGVAYIGYIIDFSWVPTTADYPDWNSKSASEKNAISTSFEELYETAEAIQLSISTKFWIASSSVKHFNNIIDVLNNIRGYNFPTNDNKIKNDWWGTQQNEVSKYKDGGYYVYDKVRHWITSKEAYDDGIL